MNLENCFLGSDTYKRQSSVHILGTAFDPATGSIQKRRTMMSAMSWMKLYDQNVQLQAICSYMI